MKQEHVLLNPALTAILEAFGIAYGEGMPMVHIAKEQPPDGLVLVLPDQTRWAVSAWRLKED